MPLYMNSLSGSRLISKCPVLIKLTVDHETKIFTFSGRVFGSILRVK